jgi:hypothetical protein
MSGKHEIPGKPHTRTEGKRVYTGLAPSDFYDSILSNNPCTCPHGENHTEIVQRVPYIPPAPA